MRKSIAIIAITAAIVSFFMMGCAKTNGDIVVIRERLFVAQVNNIYINTDDYLGKTIKFEGIFQAAQYGNSDPYYLVIRYGPGCCGDDGNVGFEVRWSDKKKAGTYPASDAWVEATGVLKLEVEDEYQYLYLDLSSLTELSKRGREYVLQ